MGVAVSILGLLGLVNLLLTVGVIRRLREHTSVLEKVGGPELMRPAGQLIDEFSTAAMDGTPVARSGLTGLTLIGFFSPTCGPCHERLPAFVARARQMPGGRVLAFVVGDGAETGDLVDRLSDVATVVPEPPGGAVTQAFGVRGFPAFGLVDASGSVMASSTDPSTLPIPVAV